MRQDLTSEDQMLIYRYQGFSRLMDAFRQLGLLSTRPLTKPPQTWDELLAASFAQATGEGLRPADIQPALKSIGLDQSLLTETTEALQL